MAIASLHLVFVSSTSFFHLPSHSIHIKMGERYLKSEIATLRRMYPSASKADIIAELPGRDWTALSAHARRKLGLHRTRKAIGLAVLAGMAEGKRKREEEGSIDKLSFFMPIPSKDESKPV